MGKFHYNGVIPYQIHLMELKKILAHAENYLPFLTEKDESGLSVSDKIISIFTFRIPYFVGPLNKHGSENAWIVKKDSAPVGEKITPWNFIDVVDLEGCADAFITMYLFSGRSLLCSPKRVDFVL